MPRWSLPLLLLILMTVPTPSRAQAEAGAALREQTYRELDQVQAEKQAQLASYLKRVGQLAARAANDSLMANYFSIKKRYWQLQQEAPPPAEARQAIEKLRESLRDHYLSYYHAFYDILFVDPGGFVLSTVRNQADNHQNIFEGKLAGTALARRLKTDPGLSFVDYEFYWVSNEPSAFFVEPMKKNGEPLGWLVLQCSLNNINEIFNRGENLGVTGETFLANKKHQMLTESRLSPGAQGLSRHLAEQNIDAKFRERSGHKRVTDYRGYPALTSFSVCSLLGSEWLLVAKIDEDEVITRYYLENQDTLRPALLADLGPKNRKARPDRELPSHALLVDMDEFRQSREEPLLTFGVATCTAVVISLPGEFAYLGHATEHDRIYGAGDMDLLEHMLRRIRQFEIHPYQLRDLQVVIVAPHRNSVDLAVRKLLKAGLFLSQIRFIEDPQAESATVLYDPADSTTMVGWSSEGTDATWWQNAADVPTLAATVETLIGYR